MKTIILATVSISALAVAFSPCAKAQLPPTIQRAEPAPPPRQGDTNQQGTPGAPGASGVGVAPHELLFKKVDTDGNGSISQSEFRIAVTTGVIPQAGVGAGAQPQPGHPAAKSGSANPQQPSKSGTR